MQDGNYIFTSDHLVHANTAVPVLEIHGEACLNWGKPSDDACFDVTAGWVCTGRRVPSRLPIAGKEITAQRPLALLSATALAGRSSGVPSLAPAMPPTQGPLLWASVLSSWLFCSSLWSTDKEPLSHRLLTPELTVWWCLLGASAAFCTKKINWMPELAAQVSISASEAI